MSDVQHKEWFITALVPHIRQPLMQQKTMTRSEALETAMKLEASPVGKTMVRMNEIQAQLENMMLQLQDIKKTNEYCDDLWCTHCHANGPTKDTCLTFQNYLLSGALSPLSGVGAPWCRSFHVYGHGHENCDYMQEMVTKEESLYCTFCRSVGHDKKNCHAYDLLQERMYDSYFVK